MPIASSPKTFTSNFNSRQLFTSCWLCQSSWFLGFRHPPAGAHSYPCVLCWSWMVWRKALMIGSASCLTCKYAASLPTHVWLMLVACFALNLLRHFDTLSDVVESCITGSKIVCACLLLCQPSSLFSSGTWPRTKCTKVTTSKGQWKFAMTDLTTNLCFAWWREQHLNWKLVFFFFFFF